MSAALCVTRLDAEALHATVAQRIGSEYRHLTTVVADDRDTNGGFRLDHVFYRPGQPGLELLRVHLSGNRPEIPSLVPLLPAVHWDEREAHDLFGVVPLGHPDPRRLVLPDNWPNELYPLRKDVPWDIQPPKSKGQDWSPLVAEGEGVVRIPVGPVHAGIIESGHFAFSTMGESVLHLDLRLFWKHRGIEKTLEGLHWSDAGTTVERTCACCSASHQAALAEAIEQLVEWEIPPRGAYLRTILLECERLYNHINDIAAIPAGASYAVASMEGTVLKERMLRLQGELFGHRYLFGTIRPGGVCRDLTTADIDRLRQELQQIRPLVERLGQRLLRHPGFMDRAQGTGVLSPSTARDLGAVGPSARASSVGWDLRKDRPTLAYHDLAPEVVTESAGDVLSRLRVRLREAVVSFALLDHLLVRLPHGPITTHAPEGAEEAHGIGVGCNESPRGANVHYLELRQGRIWRYRIRSASFANWPLLAEAVPGNLIGDFPLINKSFELCYACCDR